MWSVPSGLQGRLEKTLTWSAGRQEQLHLFQPVSPDGIDPRTWLPMASKESGKAHFKVMMSQTATVERGMVVTSVDLGLRADLGFVVGG